MQLSEVLRDQRWRRCDGLRGGRQVLHGGRALVIMAIFSWIFLEFFDVFSKFGMILPRFFTFLFIWPRFSKCWDLFLTFRDAFLDFLVCVCPCFQRSFPISWMILTGLADSSSFEHLCLVSRLGNYLNYVATSRGIVHPTK